MNNNLSIVILAAGNGKRMHSKLPKVLHPLSGIPLLERVINTAFDLKAEQIFVVYNPQKNLVKEKLSHLPIEWIPQLNALGTGHAVMQTINYLDENSRALILYGDVPLISQKTLLHLLYSTPANSIGLLTAKIDNPLGYGRIIRDSYGTFQKIIEEKDAKDSEKYIKEINTGIYLVPSGYLKKWLPNLKNDNSQNEYYFTDILSIAKEENIPIQITLAESADETLGVNTQQQLANLERIYQKHVVAEHMEQGLHVLDPARLDIRGQLSFGKDVTIDVNVVLEGKVSIGCDCYIGPNVYLRDVSIGDGVTIKANSVIEGATICENCILGPFARIRPQTVIEKEARIGNFVEVKKSCIGKGSKISHLSYIVDAVIGENVNVGAGTITCNYDGLNKHTTTIQDNAFIGSNCALVAPVNIGQGSTIGAGSTITEDAPPNKLTLERDKQVTVSDWVRPGSENIINDNKYSKM